MLHQKVQFLCQFSFLSVEVKSKYYQNSSVLDCVTQCSPSAAHLYEQFLQVKQLSLIHI